MDENTFFFFIYYCTVSLLLGISPLFVMSYTCYIDINRELTYPRGTLRKYPLDSSLVHYLVRTQQHDQGSNTFSVQSSKL